MGGAAVLETAGWLAGVWLLWRVPCCGPAGGGPAPAVAVVVPARDEAATLPTLLASVAAQAPPPAEVVVVDDHSGDGTAGVAAAAGATVVASPPLPPGWTGKTWACHTGAAATSAATLVFLDADAELEPGGLARVAGELAARGGLVSVAPDHVTRRPYEWLSAYFNVVAMMGVDAFGPLRRRLAPRGAFGPCLATSRADYQAVGGHAAVRGKVVEDVALARCYTAAGLPVACLGGRGTIRFRMYPAGPAQLVEGWTKNIAGGAGAARPATFALVFVWVAGTILAAWQLGTGPSPATAAAYTAYAVQLGWMLGRVGRFGAPAWLAFPVPLAFFLVVFARSLVLTAVRGEVRWRGRAVATGRRRP